MPAASPRIAQVSLFDCILIQRSIDTTFLNAFRSSDQSKSSTMVGQPTVSGLPSWSGTVIHPISATIKKFPEIG
jgi:hypothetical protein